MITQKRLKELLDYNQFTGKFTWLDNRHYKVKVGSEAGSIHCRGYRHIRLDGKEYKAHRLAYFYMTSEWPKDQVDHLDRDKDNNAWCNLREICNSGNQRNAPLRKNNTSGIMGVNWHNRHGKWCVRINDGKQRSHIGYFDDFFEACCARKSWENKLEYHPNHGRAI